ncbi:FtsX-like permease family protein [Antarcticibacterium flavum]|uniref:FtsX-like permease family protein n=1 Tax=Antarcticibacterium flavum TaxID=2058175 RepID=A0A5B7X6Q6_9FLAO|nr:MULTISPECIES: ABC transporter permease [Antarcticibacterium]MCM4161483.1 ABC transporter permease [Antarcticibacterium sp. W02-3]QCY71069.1 FtsX-like permease family protein [Antarcticibacterium flavum]
MIKNYLKMAWRTILKNRVYSFINVLGLTIGIWACMSMATVVIDDLSYDTKWKNADDLYRIVTVKTTGSQEQKRMAASFAGLNPVLMNDFPQVEAVSKFNTHPIHFKFSNSETEKVEVNLLNADTTVWKMLDFKIIAGDPKNFIHDKKNLIITRNLKDRFFPYEDPVGKIISDVPSFKAEPDSYVITGVIENIPSNTHLRAEAILVQKGRLEVLNKEQFGTFSQNYVQLKQGTDPDKFAQQLSNWYADFVGSKNADSFEFQPITDIYLHSEFAEYQDVKGSLNNIFILTGVALLLLIIACVNFINLSTARAIKRMQEIGMRKILGANRRQLIFQFLTEAVLFFLISTFIASLIYLGTIPLIEKFLGHALEQTFVSGLYLFGITVLILLLISLLAGGYPALIMSGYNPAKTIKGNFYTGNLSSQNTVRKSLVVLQFSISIIVLIALLVVQQQVTFLKTMDIGFNKDALLSIGSVSWDGKGDAFKNEVLKNPNIEKVSFSTWLPTRGAGYMSKRISDPAAPDKSFEVFFINADLDFAETLGLTLQKGRFLNEKYPSDIKTGNPTGIISFDEEEKAGSRASIFTVHTAGILQANNLNQDIADVKAIPVGIVEDFNTESLKVNLKPTIITAESPLPYSGMLIRTRPGAEQQVIEQLQRTWQEFYPDKLLEVNRVDEQIAAQYEAESKLQQLFAFFSGLSMFLAAMGIFGLIVQITQQHVKEIGIRKVLGASINSIVMLYSKSFFKIVVVAILIASPIAWYAMQNYLEDFAYRIALEWWMFALAGFMAIFIALVTVSLQAVKAAVVNPVKSLRTE